MQTVEKSAVSPGSFQVFVQPCAFGSDVASRAKEVLVTRCRRVRSLASR